MRTLGPKSGAVPVDAPPHTGLTVQLGGQVASAPASMLLVAASPEALATSDASASSAAPPSCPGGVEVADDDPCEAAEHAVTPRASDERARRDRAARRRARRKGSVRWGIDRDAQCPTIDERGP